MRRLLSTTAAAAVLAMLTAFAAPATARTGLAPAHGFAPHRLVVKFAGEAVGHRLALPAGSDVRASAAALRRNPRVEYALPDYIATASAFEVPDDPGTLEGDAEAATAGDWSFKQWNFLNWQGIATTRLPTSPGGIDAVDAWRHLEEAGRPGARGVTIAVLDTGIAYRSEGTAFLRSPDFASGQFTRGYDFVDKDPLPLDENGHGTHVAGTIGEKTDNAIGLTGLAYRAKLMPVRVLDARGRGDATTIAKGIRYAIAHHAQVINMSFNFGCHKKVPVVDEALREAYEHGVVTVASAGNIGSETCVSEPATGSRVLAVGGTTEGGCLGDYSLAGTAIDLVAPGGGTPVAGCPAVSARPIYQVTLKPGTTNLFAIPSDYVGTSMAAAHVSGVAAMVLASGLVKPGLRPKGRVDAIRRRLRATARSLGLPKTQQGAGLVDAGAATEPPA
ncbi:MAG: S8 family serine peptidase [Solirubrobacterales bacterium]